MKKNLLVISLTIFIAACSGSPGPGDTFLEMQKKICDKQSLTPMIDYAAPESLALIGMVAGLAEDKNKGPEIKKNIQESCNKGIKIIEEKIDGDIATLVVSNDKSVQTMRKIDGKWKLVLNKDSKKSKADERVKDSATNTENKTEVESVEVALCREKKMEVVRKEMNIQSPEEEALIPESVLKEIEKSCVGKM
jgi:hypothetical protein